VEGASDAVFVEIQGRFAYVNAAAVRLSGAASPDPLLRQPLMNRTGD
jgi:PAS domain-containing protein